LLVCLVVGGWFGGGGLWGVVGVLAKAALSIERVEKRQQKKPGWGRKIEPINGMENTKLKKLEASEGQ